MTTPTTTTPRYHFVRFTHTDGRDVIVAFQGTNMVAMQYTDRYRDPRTGYEIRKKQPIDTQPVIWASVSDVLYRMAEASHVEDDIFNSQWQRDTCREAVEYAIAYANGKGDESRLPTWSLIHEPTFSYDAEEESPAVGTSDEPSTLD